VCVFLNHISGGSLAEVFYGLTRFSSKRSAAYTKLVSFITIAILPYILIKCQHIVAKWREQILDHSAGALHREKQTAITVFQYTSGVYELTKFFQYLRFLTQSTASPTPLMAMLGMGVTFLEPQDEPEWTWRDLVGGKLKTASLLSGFLFRGLELSAFFLQFVQWWTTEAHQGDITSLPIPPPPDSHPDADKYRGICSICLQKWVIPTAVAVSGYVYCYKCVLIHVEKFGRCKVTNYPVTIDDLIRVYDDEA
jgi:peroxin-12